MLRLKISIPCLLLGASVTSTVGAQTHEFQTRSYLLNSRHNVLDANYGVVCFGGNTVPSYEGFGYMCTNGDGQDFKTVEPYRASELAVGYARRVWSLTPDGYLFSNHPQGDGISAFGTPPGGEVENMWTVGMPYLAHLKHQVGEVYPNHVEVQMTDSSIWRLKIGEYLDDYQNATWEMIRAPGEVDYAGSWWDAVNNVSFRMEVVKETMPEGDVWRTYYCESVDGECLPGSIDIPVTEVQEVVDPFSGHRRLPVSQESYFETHGQWSTIAFATYPTEYESEWTVLLDWDDATEYQGQLFPNNFFPHQEHDELEAFEYISGSRGFDRYKDGESTEWGHAAPIGFYTGSFGRQHVILYEPPPPEMVAEENELPEWQDRSQTLEFWERGISQSMLRAFAFEESGTPPPAPWQVINDRWGGPVFEIPPGWHQIPARPLDTFMLPARIQEEVALDVHIPAGATGWIGSIQLNGQVNAADVYPTYMGTVALDNLPRGEWVEITFPMPSDLRAALMGNYPGALISTYVSAGVPGIQVRGLRTKGGAYSDIRASFSNEIRPDVTTSPLFDFEEPNGWLTSQGDAVIAHGFATSGEHAAQIENGGWSEIQSRFFSTNEIPYVGATLAMDVEVPPSLPNPGWTGSVQAFLTCPAVEIWREYIERVDLQYMFTNDWNTIDFPLSSRHYNALQTPNTDCSLAITLGVQEGPNIWRIDRIGFAD